MTARKTAAAREADRFIVLRGGTFHYKRRVPEVVADLDARAPHVRASLKTKDIAVARQKRDALEAADNALWASLLRGEQGDLAQLRHAEAVKRAEALGFDYRPIGQAESTRPGDFLHGSDRVESPHDPR